jgi:hypothetical protein
MSTGDWSQAARGIGNLMVTAGMALTEEQEKILFAAVHAVWPEAPAAPAAPAAEGQPMSNYPIFLSVRKPWQVTLHYSPEVGFLTFRVASHTHGSIAFTPEAAIYCGGAVERDDDGYIVRCREELNCVQVAREIARMSEAVIDETSRHEFVVLRAQLDHARAQVDSAVKLLTGIHVLLYPPPLTLEDGRTMVFRPENPHDFMQTLSDRIRALPDQIKALQEQAGTSQPPKKC